MELATIERLLAPLRRKISNIALRAVVTLVGDGAGIARVQVKAKDDPQNNCEYFQHYGFASRVRTGAEGIVLALSGHRSHSVMIVCDDRRYRLELEDGDAALYDDKEQFVHLKKTGIHMKSPMACTMESPDNTIKGNTRLEGALTVTESVTAGVDVVAAGVSLRHHPHDNISRGHALSDPPTATV